MAIREILGELGFSTTLLGSKEYIMSQLKRLTKPELLAVRQAFIENAHLRFLKEVCCREPYGKHEIYKQKIETIGLEKLAKLINVAASLCQTKIYLFWKNSATVKQS